MLLSGFAWQQKYCLFCNISRIFYITCLIGQYLEHLDVSYSQGIDLISAYQTTVMRLFILLSGSLSEV